MEKLERSTVLVSKDMLFYNLDIVFFIYISINYIYLYLSIYYTCNTYISNNIIYLITTIIRNIYSIFFKAHLIFWVCYRKIACNFRIFCISVYPLLIIEICSVFWAFLGKEICHDYPY